MTHWYNYNDPKLKELHDSLYNAYRPRLPYLVVLYRPKGYGWDQGEITNDYTFNDKGLLSTAAFPGSDDIDFENKEDDFFTRTWVEKKFTFIVEPES